MRTLRVAAHLFLPSFVAFIWYQVESDVYVFLKMINHPPSVRKASRIQRRGRSRHLYYHKYKYRKKWKSKRSFRRVGMRHLGLRGTPVVRRRFLSPSTPKMSYMSATLWIMFYIYKLLCWMERLVRMMPACLAPWAILSSTKFIKSYVVNWYVYMRLSSSPAHGDGGRRRMSRSPDMRGYQYVCHMANNLSQEDIAEAYAASFDAFLTDEAESEQGAQQPRTVRFDTDSFIIGVDTHATKSLSSDKKLFVGMKSTPGLTCQGFGDGVGQGIDIEGIGTLVFRIEDDDGKVHVIKLPGSLYIPECKAGTLLCPQHWAQVDSNHHGRSGTCFKGDGTCMRLYWGPDGCYCKTVSFDPITNTPYFRTAPGCINYRSFNAVYVGSEVFHSPLEQVEYLPPDIERQRGDNFDYIGDELILSDDSTGPSDALGQKMPATGSPNDSSEKQEWELVEAKAILERMKDGSVKRNESDKADGGPTFNPTATPSKPNQADPNGPCPIHPKANHIWRDCSEYRRRSLIREGALTFDPSATPQDMMLNEPEAKDPKAELMRWHFRLGHMPFSRIAALAQNGDLPRRLADVDPPTCAGCMFGAMTRKRWRGKPSKPSHIFLAVNVGDCVSVDQMLSTQVGFVAQTKGRLTTQRYRAATIFVDHLSYRDASMCI